MSVFTDIRYTKLVQMSANLPDESDDERITENLENSSEPKEDEENDEFSTYFTDQKVDIPESDKVFALWLIKSSTTFHSLNCDITISRTYSSSLSKTVQPII